MSIGGKEQHCLFAASYWYFLMDNNLPTSTSPLPNLKARQIIQATLFILLVGVAFWLLIRFRSVIFILFIGIVLSTAITPVVEWLYRRGLPRAAGVILVYLLLLAFAGGFLWLAAPLILEQATVVASNLPGYYESIRNMLTNSHSFIISRLGSELPARLVLIPTSNPPVKPGTTAIDQVGQFLNYVSLVFHAVFIAAFIFLLGFYWTLDSERTIRSLLLLIPASKRDEVREIINQAQGRVGGFVLSQVLLCGTIALLDLIAYLLIGMPFALTLALFAGVMEAVPIFGPTLGAVPAVLLAASSGDTNRIILVIGATALIQFTENHLLVPRMVGKSVGVNPIVTLLALAAFTSLFGFAGALVAIPLAAIIQLLIDRYVLEPAVVPEIQEPVGRDTLSLLRMEVQELSADVRKLVREKDGDADLKSDQAEDAIEEIAKELDKIPEQTTQQKETQA